MSLVNVHQFGGILKLEGKNDSENSELELHEGIVKKISSDKE